MIYIAQTKRKHDVLVDLMKIIKTHQTYKIQPPELTFIRVHFSYT